MGPLEHREHQWYGRRHLAHRSADVPKCTGARPDRLDVRLRLGATGLPGRSCTFSSRLFCYYRADGSLQTLWHEGSVPGVTTLTTLVPSKQMAVIQLANADQKDKAHTLVLNEVLSAMLSIATPT
jgi:hypothetical protein